MAPGTRVVLCIDEGCPTLKQTFGPFPTQQDFGLLKNKLNNRVSEVIVYGSP
jgi:hypothetical protein